MLSEDITIIESGWVCDQPCCAKELAAWNRIKRLLVEGHKPSTNTARDAIAICGCLSTYDEEKCMDIGGIPSLIKRAKAISQRHP